MKDYDEMAESVLKRRDKYVAERSRQMKKVTSVLSCFCLVALLGVGVWHTGTLFNHHEGSPAGGIMPGGAIIGDASNLDDAFEKEMQQDAMTDLGSDLDGDPAGYSTSTDQPKVEDEIGETDLLPSMTIDAPVQGEPGNTGALTAYEAAWGGSYMDESGHWVIWLTENTPENQKKVFERNPDLLESNTTFKTADYSLAYLTELMANISEGMGDGKLPYVSTASLREKMNRVVVCMTTQDADSVAKVLAFDKIGGAIEIQYASGYVTDEALVKGPAK